MLDVGGVNWKQMLYGMQSRGPAPPIGIGGAGPRDWGRGRKGLAR